MPQLAKVLTQDDMQRGNAASRMDLSAYTDIIDRIKSEGGVGGIIELDEGESQRTGKRRLSIAAKQAGLKLVWRRSHDGALRFVLTEEGKPRPGGRGRRAGPRLDVRGSAVD